METNNTHENPEQQTVPFESARFLDPLEKDQEQLWQDLIVTLKETGKPTNEQLIPIWTDKAMPQVIRDRAMLVILGAWRPQYGDEPEGWTWSGLGFSTPEDIAKHERVYRGFQVQQFADWLLEMSAYQRTTGKEMPSQIFDETCLYNLSINLYELGCYSDEQLELFIESTPAGSRLVHFVTDDEYFDELRTMEAGEQFPVIADGLDPLASLPSDSRFRQWCLRQLALWTQQRDSDRSTLPEWMRHVADIQERALYDQLASRLSWDVQYSNSPKAPWLNWDAVRPGIERYGIELLFDSDRRGLELAYKIREPDICDMIMNRILTKRAEDRATANPTRPLSVEQALHVDSWARHRGHVAMIALAEVELNLTVANEEEVKRKIKESAEKYQRQQEQRLENIATQKAQVAFGKLVDRLRTG